MAGVGISVRHRGEGSGAVAQLHATLKARSPGHLQEARIMDALSQVPTTQHLFFEKIFPSAQVPPGPGRSQSSRGGRRRCQWQGHALSTCRRLGFRAHTGR